MSKLTDRGLLVASLLGTFVLTRAWLSFRPNADVFVGGYNIHHLFTGVLIVTACSIPLSIDAVGGRPRRLMIAGLGIGLALALDEVVYLIMTDGSNAAYLTRPSWIGGIVLVTLAALYAALVERKRRP
jgi:hypothetical protein